MAVFRVITHPRKREIMLVCHGKAPHTKIRGLLREHGIRPSRSCFREIPRNPLDPVQRKLPIAVYRLTGDAWLRIRALELPETTWAKLALLGMGQITVGKVLD